MTLGELLPSSMDNLSVAVKWSSDDTNGNKPAAPSWQSLQPRVVGAIRGALDIDFFACAAEIWAKARELREYAAGGEHPPEERAVVVLGEHTFTWEAHPVITVILGPLHSIPFRLTLTLKGKVQAAELLIQNGYITELRSGECSGSVQLSYGEIPLHKEAETQKIPLPGHHKFQQPGWKIPGPARRISDMAATVATGLTA